MSILPKSTVISLVAESIKERHILQVIYRHTSDGERVTHNIAPFDIGSTNPRTRARYEETLWAYSYTHIDDKTSRLDPKVCAFNINNFISIDSTGEKFDENDLARRNHLRTGYDYRGCNFALMPDRDWFL